MKIITKVVFSLILFILANSVGSSQPRDDWTRLYHLDGDETLWDIYAATNERYLICGEAHPFGQARYVSYNYLVGLLDADGDPIWLRSFGSRDRGESGQCCIEADNETSLLVALETSVTTDKIEPRPASGFQKKEISFGVASIRRVQSAQ